MNRRIGFQVGVLVVLIFAATVVSLVAEMVR